MTALQTKPIRKKPQHRVVREIGGTCGLFRQLWLSVMFRPDLGLRQQQIEIQQHITALGRADEEEIQALRAQCAVIGHVPAVIKGPVREVCFYCGAKIE